MDFFHTVEREIYVGDITVQRYYVTLTSPLKELAYIHQLLSVVISRPSGSQGIINRQGAEDSRVGFTSEMRSWLNLLTRTEFAVNICRFALIYKRLKKTSVHKLVLTFFSRSFVREYSHRHYNGSDNEN